MMSDRFHAKIEEVSVGANGKGQDFVLTVDKMEHRSELVDWYNLYYGPEIFLNVSKNRMPYCWTLGSITISADMGIVTVESKNGKSKISPSDSPILIREIMNALGNRVKVKKYNTNITFTNIVLRAISGVRTFEITFERVMRDDIIDHITVSIIADEMDIFLSCGQDGHINGDDFYTEIKYNDKPSTILPSGYIIQLRQKIYEYLQRLLTPIHINTNSW